jgi:hypothetical protein
VAVSVVAVSVAVVSAVAVSAVKAVVELVEHLRYQKHKS